PYSYRWPDEKTPHDLQQNLLVAFEGLFEMRDGERVHHPVLSHIHLKLPNPQAIRRLERVLERHGDLTSERDRLESNELVALHRPLKRGLLRGDVALERILRIAHRVRGDDHRGSAEEAALLGSRDADDRAVDPILGDADLHVVVDEALHRSSLLRALEAIERSRQ